MLLVPSDVLSAFLKYPVPFIAVRGFHLTYFFICINLLWHTGCTNEGRKVNAKIFLCLLCFLSLSYLCCSTSRQLLWKLIYSSNIAWKNWMIVMRDYKRIYGNNFILYGDIETMFGNVSTCYTSFRFTVCLNQYPISLYVTGNIWYSDIL